jgi:ATP-binding cassette subfamily F protein uup
LGIHDLDKPITSLSGGQRKRVAMAKILIEEPDLIIMDEPTNHLDLETIEWLEQTLSSQNVTLLLVTHDRYFLDRVCNNIVELDNGKTYPYKGNYGYFLEKKLNVKPWKRQVSIKLKTCFVLSLNGCAASLKRVEQKHNTV